MPHREHSARDGCQRILCKVGSGQRGGQTGVLHTDLDGDRAALGGIQLQQLAHTEAGEVAQQVVQDDHGKDQQAAGHDLGGVCRNNSADDEHDGGGGDQRQHADGVLSEGVEEVVDHKAQCDGHQHYFDDGQEHIYRVHIHALTGIQQGEQGSQDGCQHGGNGSHTDGQCNVALGQIGHHVRGGAAGAGTHKDDADSQLGGQVEQLRQRPCKEGHQGELRNAANDHVFRAAEHHLEVLRLQGKTHAEHDDAQQGVDPCGLYHTEGAGEQQRQCRHHNDDGGHVLAHKVAYFFQCFHDKLSFFLNTYFCGCKGNETSGKWLSRKQKRLCPLRFVRDKGV